MMRAYAVRPWEIRQMEESLTFDQLSLWVHFANEQRLDEAKSNGALVGNRVGEILVSVLRGR